MINLFKQLSLNLHAFVDKSFNLNLIELPGFLIYLTDWATKVPDLPDRLSY